MTKVYGKSLREQALERRCAGLQRLLDDEMRKNFEWERQYDTLKENFHVMATLKMSQLTQAVLRKKPH